ncbi:zinc finger MYND domain-containing protein 12 [Aythya fuligula]|uniref:Zinc finger MYND domain-containing protein 12 n=1 Tax=Aythya fuligula TaxID=219594 RepID=A0A6J3E332_AYTFU|nr:zinc finger MYND domain-containing protein 12 [Aythya fuligula]
MASSAPLSAARRYSRRAGRRPGRADGSAATPGGGPGVRRSASSRAGPGGGRARAQGKAERARCRKQTPYPAPTSRSAEAAPRRPLLKFSRKRTARASSGTCVPPDVTSATRRPRAACASAQPRSVALATLERPRRCELCGAAARLRCGRCRLTHYCDADHQKADWVSIHEKICQLLVPVRTSLPFLIPEEERKHGVEQLVKRQKYIIDLTYSTAQKFLWDGKHEKAMPAALHALRFSTEVYGSSSVQLVPAYLLLAEACIGVGHHLQASKYLSQAQWIVLRTPDCSTAVQHRLHRSLGLLCAAEGNFEQALYHLANDIYLASSTFGLKSIETSGGCFHMANVFFRQNKMDIADSLYAEVTDIWHAFLTKSVQTQEQIHKSRAEKSPFTEDKEISEDNMTEAQQAEAIQVLNAVLDIREQAPKQQPGETARVLHALAMLYYLVMDLSKAYEMGTKAFDLLKQLPQQESLEAIGRLLKLINSKPFYTK